MQRDWCFESKVFSELENAQFHRTRLQGGQSLAGVVLLPEAVLPRSKQILFHATGGWREKLLRASSATPRSGQHGNCFQPLQIRTHLVFPGAGWKIRRTADMELPTWSLAQRDGVREVVLKSRSEVELLGESTTEELASNYLKSG